MSQPMVLNTVADLRRQLARWRARRETVALVPTMGALHAGHISLGSIAKSRADHVVYTIFVNPTQFAPNEDFSAYPRTFADDCAKIAELGAEAVFAPTPAIMYPEGFATTITLTGPATAGLEDRFRPTHFAGVATVVAKLLIQAMPDLAVFGEKDFQQLTVIRQLTRDLDLPITIAGGPTLRESDGLAMSSRNVYLSSEERATAPLLQRVLSEAAAAIEAGEDAEHVLNYGRERIAQGGFELDYLEWRDAMSLGLASRKKASRLLVAARIGKTRLIDNVGVAAGV